LGKVLREPNCSQLWPPYRGGKGLKILRGDYF